MSDFLSTKKSWKPFCDRQKGPENTYKNHCFDFSDIPVTFFLRQWIVFQYFEKAKGQSTHPDKVGLRRCSLKELCDHLDVRARIQIR